MIKKVAIVTKSLSGGGAERAAAMLSVMLNNLGYEIHNIVLHKNISFTYSGKLHVLQTTERNNKQKQFKKFKNIFKEQQFDLVIDFRGKTNVFRELLINYFIYKSVRQKIFTIHSSLPEEYLPSPFNLFKNTYKKGSNIISVSKKMGDFLKTKYNLKNITTIPNAIDINEINLKKKTATSLDTNYALFVGRLDNSVKQVDKLIKAYSQTNLIKKGIKLLIIGDGKDRGFLEAQVNKSSLNKKVLFLPFQENVYAYMAKAKFLVLCSKREGFPYVLLEALACKRPVISFDCFTGPSEIIEDNYNGLLVENQNFEALKQAMNVMVNDDKLYDHLKFNTLKSVKKYDANIIQENWQKLLNTLISNIA